MNIQLASSLDQWEDIVADVDKQHVPLDVVKLIELHMFDSDTHKINVEMLRDEGLGLDELELLVTGAMVDAKDSLTGLEFVVDVELVKECVAPLTYHLLRQLDNPFIDDDDDDDQ